MWHEYAILCRTGTSDKMCTLYYYYFFATVADIGSLSKKKLLRYCCGSKNRPYFSYPRRDFLMFTGQFVSQSPNEIQAKLDANSISKCNPNFSFSCRITIIEQIRIAFFYHYCGQTTRKHPNVYLTLYLFFLPYVLEILTSSETDT